MHSLLAARAAAAAAAAALREGRWHPRHVACLRSLSETRRDATWGAAGSLLGKEKEEAGVSRIQVKQGGIAALTAIILCTMAGHVPRHTSEDPTRLLLLTWTTAKQRLTRSFVPPAAAAAAAAVAAAAAAAAAATRVTRVHSLGRGTSLG